MKKTWNIDDLKCVESGKGSTLTILLDKEYVWETDDYNTKIRILYNLVKVVHIVTFNLT